MVNQVGPGMGYGAASQTQAQVDAGLRKYMLGVYNYMASGVLLTGIIAMAFAHVPALSALLFNVTPDGRLAGVTPLWWVAVFAPLGMSFFLGAAMTRMSAAGVQAMFWVYCGLFGLSMASIFFRFTDMSIARVFFIAAAMFGALSLWGYTTKKNLSGMGTFLFMGMIGLLIASVINIFLGSSMLYFITSALGVLIFAGFTAYCTQQTKDMYSENYGSEGLSKLQILGAWNLYTSFIAMFQSLLALFGQQE
jgi:uncharacterized protein